MDLLKLYNRLAFLQVSIAACKPEVLQHVLVHLEQLASMGGGPSQAYHQVSIEACMPEVLQHVLVHFENFPVKEW
jgi:hypothetical protein